MSERRKDSKRLVSKADKKAQKLFRKQRKEGRGRAFAMIMEAT